MAIALVGTIGAVSQGGSGVSVTPAWGTSETRAANNLLVLWVSVTGSATLPAAPSGWSVGKQVAATSSSASIFYKVAAGSDAAPTVAGITSGNISARLAEYSGAASINPLDQTASATGTTTSPVTATAGAVDVDSGSLLVSATALVYSAAATKTLTPSFNNATATSTTNAATSTTSHYAYAYGVSTANASADFARITYTTTNATGVAEVLVSFKFNMPPSVALNTPTDTATVGTATPQLAFTGTDADGEAVTYEVQVDSINTFDSTPGVTSAVIDSYSETNSDGTIDLVAGSRTAGGQSFTSNGYTINSVQFYLKKTGTPTGTATANIYAHSGTFGSSSVPTGSALATSNTLSVSTLSTSFQLITLTFPSPLSTVNGTNYVVTLEWAGDGTNQINMGRDISSPGHGGNIVQFAASWSSISGQDMCFYVNGLGPGPAYDKLSASDSGFTDITNGAHTDPFTSGEQIGYTMPSLSDGTYYWRVRGKDPAGSNAYGAWSSTRSFTVSTGGGATNTGQFFAFF